MGSSRAAGARLLGFLADAQAPELQLQYIIEIAAEGEARFARSGQPRDTWAGADVTRIGRRLATVAVRVWQDDAGRAIATGQAHFLLS